MSRRTWPVLLTAVGCLAEDSHPPPPPGRYKGLNVILSPELSFQAGLGDRGYDPVRGHNAARQGVDVMVNLEDVPPRDVSRFFPPPKIINVQLGQDPEGNKRVGVNAVGGLTNLVHLGLDVIRPVVHHLVDLVRPKPPPPPPFPPPPPPPTDDGDSTHRPPRRRRKHRPPSSEESDNDSDDDAHDRRRCRTRSRSRMCHRRRRRRKHGSQEEDDENETLEGEAKYNSEENTEETSTN